MINTKRIASLLGATLLFSLPACSSQSLDEPAPETEEIEVESQNKNLWKGRGFTREEAFVLEFLQGRGITDRNALAVILGNIKQESKFDTLVCEGGSRTGYANCFSGGFGIIQWTTPSRYRGLGQFASKYGLNPDLIETQLRWMVNEREWQLVEHIFKAPNQSKGSYMNAAYRWLGWGIAGDRTHYSNNYYNALYRL